MYMSLGYWNISPSSALIIQSKLTAPRLLEIRCGCCASQPSSHVGANRKEYSLFKNKKKISKIEKRTPANASVQYVTTFVEAHTLISA